MFSVTFLTAFCSEPLEIFLFHWIVEIHCWFIFKKFRFEKHCFRQIRDPWKVHLHKSNICTYRAPYVVLTWQQWRLKYNMDDAGSDSSCNKAWVNTGPLNDSFTLTAEIWLALFRFSNITGFQTLTFRIYTYKVYIKISNGSWLR